MIEVCLPLPVVDKLVSRPVPVAIRWRSLMLRFEPRLFSGTILVPFICLRKTKWKRSGPVALALSATLFLLLSALYARRPETQYDLLCLVHVSVPIRSDLSSQAQVPKQEARNGRRKLEDTSPTLSHAASSSGRTDTWACSSCTYLNPLSRKKVKMLFGSAVPGLFGVQIGVTHVWQCEICGKLRGKRS